MAFRKITLALLPLLLISSLTVVQDTVPNGVLTLREVLDLTVKNSVQLKITGKNTELAKERTALAKLYRLPDLSTQLSYGYLSNTDIWNPSFSTHQLADNPHQFANFTVQASEVIFGGGQVKNEIRKATLEEKVAFLSEENNIQAIKLLAASQYLDIYRLINLKQVYINNTHLAEQRLKNIQVMRKQGMVTENDVLRNTLILSDLELSIRKTENSIVILNSQLNLLTGRPDSAILIPDSSMLRKFPVSGALASWLDTAVKANHELKIAAGESLIAETNVRIAGADRYPSLGVFAGTDLQRPFLYTIPSVDIYYNLWQAGIGLKYNISSIYQAPKKIKAARIQLEQSKENEMLQKQQVNVDVKSKYIKYKEAEDELETLQHDLHSAEENYRIVEKKYYNQLSLLADLIDGSSTKIESEIKVSNARINMVYTYLQLLKSVGTL